MSLSNFLEDDLEYQTIVFQNRFMEMVLHKLIKKISNGSASVVIEDVTEILIDALCSHVLIRGDDYSSLLKCLDMSSHMIDSMN